MTKEARCLKASGDLAPQPQEHCHGSSPCQVQSHCLCHLGRMEASRTQPSGHLSKLFARDSGLGEILWLLKSYFSFGLGRERGGADPCELFYLDFFLVAVSGARCQQAAHPRALGKSCAPCPAVGWPWAPCSPTLLWDTGAQTGGMLELGRELGALLLCPDHNHTGE